MSDKIYIVLLGDGMAGYPIDALGGKTALEYAKTPNMDYVKAHGTSGLIQTVPKGMKPGSDVANLSVMGYDPAKYYTGRSSLEALSIGIDMKATDYSARANLVTLSCEADFSKKTMVDYSAGEISTAEATELIKAVEKELGTKELTFYAGTSYRNCLISHKKLDAQLTPPHDISGKGIEAYLPKGADGELLCGLIKRSGEILKDHPVNKAREAIGKNPATHLWFWGIGTRPALPDFKKMTGLSGTVISAVDLLKGIAIAGGMHAPTVTGATGTLHSNFSGKLQALKHAVESGDRYVYLHIEAPDECGHQGDLMGKVKAIEIVDGLLGEILAGLKKCGHLPYSVAILSDHATPIALKTHTSEPVPYLLYNSEDAEARVKDLSDGPSLLHLMLNSYAK